jgi:hypothetical protein
MIIPLFTALEAGASMSPAMDIRVILCQLVSRKLAAIVTGVVALPSRRTDALSLKLTQLRSVAKWFFLTETA